MTQTKWFIFGAAGSVMAICFLCVACLTLSVLVNPSRRSNTALSEESDTGGPQPIAPTSPRVSLANPTTVAPIDPITYKQIEDQYNALTGIQRKDYLPTLAGKHIRWKASIREVHDNADVSLDMSQRGLTNSVRLRGTPKDVALSFTRNQTIEFEALIQSVDDIMGMQMTLKFVSMVGK